MGGRARIGRIVWSKSFFYPEGGAREEPFGLLKSPNLHLILHSENRRGSKDLNIWASGARNRSSSSIWDLQLHYADTWTLSETSTLCVEGSQ